MSPYELAARWHSTRSEDAAALLFSKIDETVEPVVSELKRWFWMLESEDAVSAAFEVLRESEPPAEGFAEWLRLETKRRITNRESWKPMKIERAFPVDALEILAETFEKNANGSDRSRPAEKQASPNDNSFNASDEILLAEGEEVFIVLEALLIEASCPADLARRTADHIARAVDDMAGKVNPEGLNIGAVANSFEEIHLAAGTRTQLAHALLSPDTGYLTLCAKGVRPELARWLTLNSGVLDGIHWV